MNGDQMEALVANPTPRKLQISNWTRFNCCKFLMRKSASRLSRDQALLALRLPEPRRTGFGGVGAERLWLRAVAGFYGISRSAPPRAHPEREPQRPSAAEWDCPINASVPSPRSIRQPDRGVRPSGPLAEI